MTKCNKLLLPLLLACFHNTVFAGGPLATSATDAPIVYPNGGSSITVNYDLGSLGSRSESQTAALLNQARSTWNNISTSTVNIIQGNNLATNVTSSNFQTQLNNNSNNNLIIFDSNGEITQDFFGEHQQNYVTSFNLSSNDGTHITKAQIVLNGNVTNSKTDDEVLIAMTHALGRMIGLDHTQLDESQGLATTNVPMMYPLLHRSTPTLHEDDIIAISTLYPAANNFGTLSGSFIQQSGEPIRGANIWLKETTTNKVYSSISDYYEKNNGDFSLNLPPGTYTVHAESIQTNFYGNYRIGPYSQNQTDISFQSPHPLTSIAYGQTYPSEEGKDEEDQQHHSHSSTPSIPSSTGSALEITITEGNTRHINFNLSGSIPSSDHDVDIDGVNDNTDNCPLIFNPTQSDFDADAQGDACDTDNDNDGIIDVLDNCPATANPTQSNFDTDSQGDACDMDDDNDGLTDVFEAANGLNPLDATSINGATGDADSDGFTNLEEQIVGSDASLESGATSNPGFINFSATTLSVNEDAGVANIGVTRTGGSIGAVSVYCFSTDIASEAVAGSDYDAVTSYIDWADGDATDKTCNITINNDTETETDETLQLDLSNPTGGAKLGEL